MSTKADDSETLCTGFEAGLLCSEDQGAGRRILYGEQGPDGALAVVYPRGPAKQCRSGSCGLREMEVRKAKLGSSHWSAKVKGDV